MSCLANVLQKSKGKQVVEEGMQCCFKAEGMKSYWKSEQSQTVKNWANFYMVLFFIICPQPCLSLIMRFLNINLRMLM